MSPGRLFQGMLPLGVVLVLTSQISAQQPPAFESGSKPKAVSTARLSPREFAERKKSLLKAKNVDKWPLRGTLTRRPGQFVVALSVSECTWLGGSVVYWSNCGDTLMKCVGPSGREMCIDTVK